MNYTQATTIPARILNETDEMLIEKQAIIDVLLDTRCWGEKYVTNPFPYIEENITKIKLTISYVKIITIHNYYYSYYYPYLT